MRSILWAALALVASAGAAAATTRSCSVTGKEGAGIEIESGGQWRPLAGGVLPEGTVRLRTDASTRAEITCDDGIVVTVGTATAVDLVWLTGEAGSERHVLLRLSEGIVGLLAPLRNWAGFTVETPLAIASIRSTVWLVEHEAATGTAVFVREGEVGVAAGRERFGLKPAEGITIPADGPPGAVTVWGEARVARAIARLGFGWL
jgi:hypothetical protein